MATAWWKTACGLLLVCLPGVAACATLSAAGYAIVQPVALDYGEPVVYGIALTFGATGVTSILGIVAAVSGGSANMTLLMIGAALVLSTRVLALSTRLWETRRGNSSTAAEAGALTGVDDLPDFTVTAITMGAQDDDDLDLALFPLSPC